MARVESQPQVEVEREPAVFGTAIEALLKAVGPRLGPAGVTALKEVGVDGNHLLPAYSVGQWAQTVEILARTVFPQLPQQEADFRLGQEFMLGYERTLVGKALLAFAKVVGIRRMVGRLSSSLRTGANYVETRVELQPGAAILETWVADDMLAKVRAQPETSPHYLHGILQQAAEQIGGKAAKVELLSYVPETTRARFKLTLP